MTKQEQKAINRMVENQISEFNDADLNVVSCTRLLTCNASVIEYIDNITGEIIYALQSYDTIVALLYGNCLYDILRYVYGYTATSAQHIAKFMREYCDRYYPETKVYRWRYVG